MIERLLLECNDAKIECPNNKMIHDLFEEQVEKTPDSIAIVYRNKELTYLELNERSNQVACYLKGMGVELE